MFTSQGIAAANLGGLIRDSDDPSLRLRNVSEIVSAVINGTTFIYTGSSAEDAIEVFTLSDAGSLTRVGTIIDGGVSALQDIRALEVFEVGGTQFLVAAGEDDSGFSVFSLSDTAPFLSLTDSALEALDPAQNLSGVSVLEVVTTSSGTFIYAASDADNGLAIYSVDGAGTLTFVANVNDTAALEIGDVRVMQTFETNSGTMLAVADADNATVSVFSIDDVTGMPTFVTSLAVPAATNMVDIASFEVGSNAFLYIADGFNGLFTLNFNGSSLTLTAQNSGINGRGVSSVETFDANGEPYLVVQPENRNVLLTYEIEQEFVGLGSLNLVDTVGTTSGATRDHRLGTLAQVGEALFWLSPDNRLEEIRAFEIGAGADILSTTFGTLSGGRGNDVLIATSFGQLDGGEGADTLIGNSVSPDRVTADYAGSDAGVTVNVQTGEASGGEAEGDVLIGVGNLNGSAFADTLTGQNVEGNDGSDLITLFRPVAGLGQATADGGRGNDTIIGTDLSDRINGGFSQDSILSGGGDDIVIESPGNDFMDGGDDVDLVVFSGFNGSINVNLNTSAPQNNGPAGTNVILNFESVQTGNGNDTLTGTTGENTLFSSSGSDRIFGLGGDDLIVSGPGNDLVLGGGGADFIFGENDRDTIDGGSGNDTIDGGEGNDVVRGGAGEDMITGSLGRDIMSGGTFSGGSFVGDGDTDTFLYVSTLSSSPGASTRDIIRDFEVGIDLIDVSAIDAITGGNDDAFTFVGTAAFSGTAGELRLASAGAFTIVQADVDGDGLADFEVRLDGAPVLTASDFVL